MNQKTVEEANAEAEALRRLYAGKTLTPAEKMKIPAQEMPNQEASVRARKNQPNRAFFGIGIDNRQRNAF